VPVLWWGSGALVVYFLVVVLTYTEGYITCSDQWLNDLIDGVFGVVSLPFKGRLSILRFE